jgi:outer membrane autotransporter protein
MTPSVLSLINAQTGTWRQRMGVIDGYNRHALSLWARVFSEKGSFSPDHVNGNFGPGGNFDWDQRNRGFEAGADLALTDQFSLGAMVARGESDIDLASPGVGSMELDADTFGVYGTWIASSGWYFDASYRWVSFEAELTSSMGLKRSAGHAETFNFEAGYAWTLASGLKVEPQIQYTHTDIDDIDLITSNSGETFQADELESSRGRVGVSVRKSFGDADTGWQWTPYATLSAVREFEGQANYTLGSGQFGYTDVEGTSALLELGFNARSGNVAVYGGLDFQDGGAIDSFFGGHLGIRYTFGGPAPAPAPVVAPPAKTCADLDDDGDGVNNCDDKCPGSTAGTAVGADGCPVPPAPEPEPVMEPKPYRG